mmetsp:Transcript_74451/g.206772  ORF Transcript_74451/g.206772 Transcript_74451/m.206772 type:complete len:511 (-) Transcript_74451:33-1565(-)
MGIGRANGPQSFTVIRRLAAFVATAMTNIVAMAMVRFGNKHFQLSYVAPWARRSFRAAGVVRLGTHIGDVKCGRCPPTRRALEKVVEGIVVDFESSDMGQLRRSFLEEHQLTRSMLPEHNSGRLPVWADEEFTYQVVPHQVRRDIEQLEHLVSTGVLDRELHDYVVKSLLPEYRRMLIFASVATRRRNDAYIMTHPQRDFAHYFALQKKVLHVHPGDAVAGDAISSTLDFEALQDSYFQKDHHVVVIDSFLSQEVLQLLHDFLLESTIWMEVKFGHVGAYLDSGMACPLIAQIDSELRAKFPRVMGDLEFENAWAYMYDGSMGGVGIHADDAQVQINIFVTPTEANLWSDDSSEPTGGLVIYGIGPPQWWECSQYNNIMRNPRILEVLASIDHWNMTVPYVQNRAVMFDSTYFHQSDDMSFKKGYRNRRINVTFLYGRRSKLVPQPAVKPSVGSRPQGGHGRTESTSIVEQRDEFYRRGEIFLDADDWDKLRAAIREHLSSRHARQTDSR